MRQTSAFLICACVVFLAISINLSEEASVANICCDQKKSFCCTAFGQPLLDLEEAHVDLIRVRREDPPVPDKGTTIYRIIKTT